MPRSQYVSHIRRIVVKIGSASITERGVISPEKIDRFASQIADLVRKGYEVLVVSSGSITAGSGELCRDLAHLTIPQKQALAAVGQTLLMNEYRQAFKHYDICVGQILMTEDDVKNRRRFLNLRNTCNTLINMGVVPVINENDSVVVKEIKLGDNDTLSVHVANMVEAQLLVLLSDINGFYHNLSDPEPADIIHTISDEIIRSAGGSGSKYGTGGMMTKVAAADVIIRSGEMMVIARADEDNVLGRIVRGEKVGTLFAAPEGTYMPGRKRWISFNMKSKGTLTVDDGAHRALTEKKKSLLAIGIIGYTGEFYPGDAVDIQHNGTTFAKGIVNYSVSDMELVMGKRTDEIEEVAGGMLYNEVIHRDNMIVFP